VPLADDIRAVFTVKVNTLFDPHPAGLNLEQFSTVVQEVKCGWRGADQHMALTWQLGVHPHLSPMALYCTAHALRQCWPLWCRPLDYATTLCRGNAFNAAPCHHASAVKPLVLK